MQIGKMPFMQIERLSILGIKC